MEMWRPTVEFPEDYEISSIGRLRRISAARGATVGRIRKSQLRNGYPSYGLKIGRKTIIRYAHRLLADAFLGPIPPKMQVNHIDGNRANCDVRNLEIVTNGQNRAHAYRVLGVKPNRGKLGEAHHNARLTWDEVCNLRKEYSEGQKVSALAERYNISQEGIRRILSGKVRREA